MKRARGISIWCEPDGRIFSIATDTLEIGPTLQVGTQFPYLADHGDVSRALSFLNEINKQGAAFDWVISIPVHDQPMSLHFTGCKFGENMIITGAEDINSADVMLQSMLSMHNQQSDALRISLKENQINNDIYYEFSRMNNELVSAQRELSKKIAELTAANARLEVTEAELRQTQTQLENRVQERTAELLTANQKLELAVRVKDEFLTSMSHELRTPLSNILGLTDVLQLPSYGPLSDKQKTAIKHIRNSGGHLLTMVNDVLDLAILETGKLTLNLGPCTLDEICQASLQAVASLATAKHLQTSISIAPKDITLMANTGRLTQIVNNLLDNAIKFTPQHGSLGVEVLGSADETQLSITVWDTGIGIRESDLHRLFQPFVQLDARLARQYPGAGLGLVLARKLTELHGGSISVESTPGQGSRFTVSLPWVKVQE